MSTEAHKHVVAHSLTHSHSYTLTHAQPPQSCVIVGLLPAAWLLCFRLAVTRRTLIYFQQRKESLRAVSYFHSDTLSTVFSLRLKSISATQSQTISSSLSSSSSELNYMCHESNNTIALKHNSYTSRCTKMLNHRHHPACTE